MQLVSLNATDQAQPVQISDSRVDQSAIYKQPQGEAVWLGAEGLANDIQIDRRYHGGPDRAICLYALEHYPHWAAKLGKELQYGAFGENFSSTGLLEDEVCIGDSYRVGEVVVQVSEPRGPCNTLAARWQQPKLVRWVQQHGSTGFYFRVLQPGHVRAGDAITLLARPAHGVTVSDVNQAMYRAKSDLGVIEHALTAPELGPDWRQKLDERLANRRRKLARAMAGV